jgi:RHS repeat-associated protein
MKKYLYFPILLLLLATNYLHLQAQIAGRSGNSQNPGKEVKTESITSGSLANDVNLFTGTLNTSYTLGSVKTLSGLSFTASLSYNSSFSSGDNMPHLSGVPYGEGWGLDVPMISISTEDFNKYTPQQMENMANGLAANGTVLTEKTPTYIDYNNNNNCDQAKTEGRVFWFAPTVNIPGVGGGRMVFKIKEGNEFVFVPNRFEKYMEARLDMTNLQWRVITDDGTIYTFKYLTMQHRNPTNQRVQESCQTPDVLKNIVLPKTEITTWYCDKISHPNHVDQINFLYETYGKFDFMKVFKTWDNRITGGYFNLTGGSNMLILPAKDIFIRKISTSRDELVFNYSVIASTGGTKLPDVTYSFVDSLYASKVVYSTAGSGNSFSNWRRYNHIRSDESSLSCDRNSHLPFNSPLNPYLSANSPQIGLANANGLYSYKSLTGTNPVPFNHGFLESPILTTASYDIVPGDQYEVKYSIAGNYNTLFDINVGTGDNKALFGGGASSPMNSNTMLKFDCWNKKSGESVYSTFNQAIKWSPYGSSPVTKLASGFFQMPNFPNTHDGIYLQVGPANSDINYSKGSSIAPNDLTFLGTSGTPNLCNAYLQSGIGASNEQSTDNSSSPSSIIRSGGSIPNNFGIGQPWFMMKRRNAGQGTSFYGAAWECEGAGAQPLNVDNIWWNDKKNEANVLLPSCVQNVPWPNKPSSATSTTAKLEYAELVRYAKKPYMLASVEYKVKNASQTSIAIQRLNLTYSIVQLTNYASAVYDVSTGQSNLTYNTGKTRNQVLLQSIVQVAADKTALTADKTPTTKFTYTLFNPVTSALTSGNWRRGIYPLNGNAYILQKVVDPLGKTTEIEYYPLPRQTDATFTTINSKQPDSLSYMVVNYSYNPRPSEFKAKPFGSDCNCTYPAGHPSNSSPTLTAGGDVRIGRTFTYQTYLVVKLKKETDRDNLVRVLKYSFDSIVYNFTVDRPSFSTQFLYDYSNNTIKAGFRKATVEGPYYGTSVTVPSGPFITYRHHSNSLFWGKPFQIESKKSKTGTVVSNKRMLYKNLLAFDKPWTAQNPLTNLAFNPDFPNLTNPQTFDMPYFYETWYATAINTANADYLRSYFVKLVSDSTTTYEVNGNYTMVNEYTYFDANNSLQTTSEGYRVLLNSASATITLSAEPSWQLFRTKSYSTAYTGGTELYNISDNFYLYDLVNNSAYATAGVVNTNFRNLRYVIDKKMRNLPFETRVISKQSFSDGAKRQSSNIIYQKFFETGADPLTGRLLPTASWVQVDTLASTATMSFQSTNNFRAVVGWQYLLTDSISGYNQYNLAPATAINALGLVTTNTYNQYTGLPTQQEVGTGQSGNLITTYTYNTDNTLATANYPNNLSYSYNYDRLKRPTLLKRNGTELQRTVYNQYNSSNINFTFQQRMAVNYVRTTSFLSATDTTLTFTYFDPLGRTTGVVEDGALKGNAHYDVFDRTIYTRRPVLSATPTTVLPTTGIATDYLQFRYDAAPRSRAVQSAKYGQDIALTTAKTTRNQYTIIMADSLTTMLTQAGLSAFIPVGTKFMNETVIDEDGKINRVISNLFGQKVADISGSGIAATVYYYNASGQVLRVVNSNGQASSYRYNYLNWLASKKTPDEGTVRYCYNKAGQVIMDFNGVAETRAYQYDVFSRMILQKYLGTSIPTTLYANEGMVWRSGAQQSYDGYLTNATYATEKKWIYNAYDAGSTTLFATATNTLLTGGGQTNARGRLAQINSYNLAGVPVNIQLLSYTTDGFLGWEVQQFNELGITAANKGTTTKLDYLLYNRAGSLIKENVDLNYDAVLDMQYYRTYDKRNRLKDVYVSYTDVGIAGRKIVTYYYDDATNLITKKNFYDRNVNGTCTRQVDSVNYYYDTRYRLNRMNSRNFDYYLAYDANQPPANTSGNLVSTNYNGNINGIYANYKSIFTGVANFTGATAYTYQYDNLNRLTSADARVARTTAYSSLTANQLLYGDNTFTYDRIGNISTTSIWLMNPANTTVEQYGFTYAYAAGKNALTTINKVAGSGLGLDRTLTTDIAGRLTGDTKKSLSTVTYRPSGLVWEHSFSTTNAPKTKYLYDAADRRIYKEQSNNTPAIVSKEYYLYDALGHEIMIIDRLGLTANTYYVHGREREARFPEGRTTAGGSGLVGGGGGSLYRSSAVRNDAYELPYPNRFYLVTRKDSIAPLGYLLETEMPKERGLLQQMQTVMLNRPEDRFVVTDSSGHNPRLMDVQEILSLRATGERFYLEGYSDACASTEMSAAALLPPPSAIDPRFYIYDHLGNTRVVYNTTVTGCTTHTYTLEYAADYSPYGRILRSFTAAGASRERFLTTGHERDPETGYDNRGARLYDAEIGRFLTVDPLAAKYAGWSTYNYVLGNPVKFVDPDGKEPDDNIVYLLALKGANKTTVKAAEKNLNTYLEAAGLGKTVQVVMVEDPSNFDITCMDPSDVVAVIGGNKSDIAEYILNKIPSDYTSGNYKKEMDSFASSTPQENPEKSDVGDKGWGYVIATTTTMYTPKANVGDTPYHKSLNVKPGEAVGLSILHGMGHTAGIGHGYASKDFGFMTGGNLLPARLKESGSVVNLIKNTVKNESKTMEIIYNRYKGEPKLNYDPNKK